MGSATEARLEGGFAAFVVADADGFIDLADEYLAVADTAGAGRAYDGLNCAFSAIVCDNQFDLDLGQKIDRVFATAIELGVTLLSAMAASLENGHSLYARFEQRVFDCIQLGWLEDGFNLEHEQLPRKTAYQA